MSSSIPLEIDATLIAKATEKNIRGLGMTERACIERALELLKDLNLEIEDIGRQLGFRKGSFTKVFARITGVNPSEYRQSLPPENKTKKSDSLMRTVAATIDNANLEKDNLRAKTLAEKFGIDRHTFVLRFKQEMGIPISDYIRNRRTTAAIELLKETDLRVDEIARLVGFKTPQWLTKAVREKTGLSASEYRKSIEGEKRIARAKDLIREDRELDLSEVARQSGFKSLPDMYTAFREAYGYSASSFRLHATSAARPA